MLKKQISYDDTGVQLEAYAVYPDEKKRPAVILCHAWRGLDDFIRDKAETIARWGYVSFAIDMYGKGVLGKDKKECAALKKPFIEDRMLLLRRVTKGYETATMFSPIDTSRMAVLGYGFGGVCALDLARSGAALKAAISVYGHFNPPTYPNQTKAKILILHGYNDPVATQDELHAFEREMDAAKVDWQVHLFGNTLHAFATPSANDPASGLLYNPASALRAERSLRIFLEEAL